MSASAPCSPANTSISTRHSAATAAAPRSGHNEGTNQRWILKDVTDKNAIRPSAAQLEKRVKEQVEEAAQEAAKAAKKAARKAPAKKSAAKTTATRTCRAKKTAETSAAETAAKPRRPRKSTSKSDETT